MSAWDETNEPKIFFRYEKEKRPARHKGHLSLRLLITLLRGTYPVDRS